MQANVIKMAFNWAFSQQFMHTGGTHTPILLIFIMNFTFTPWQIESEKKPHPTNSWPFSRLFKCTEGIRAALKVSCAAKTGCSKQIPPGVPVCHQQWERLNNTFLKDTCNGNINPLFHSEQLCFLCRHLYMDHIFSEAQFPDNFITVSLIFPAQNYFQLQTKCYF